MNRRPLLCLAGLSLVFGLGLLSSHYLAPQSTNADDNAQKLTARTCDVALLDVGKVYGEYVEFKKQMDLLKQEMGEFQAKAELVQAEIKEQSTQAKTLKEGTEPRIQEDLRLVRRTNELQLEMTLKQKRLMEAEAKVYHETYKRVLEQTSAYAKANGLRLVLRYNSNVINPDDRKSVLEGVNNNVVFQDGLDITPEIIRRLNNAPEKS